jgi:hypothetical protein
MPRGKIIRPKSRNAGRYARGQKAKKIYGSKTPTDAQIKAQALAERAKRIAATRAAIKNPPVKVKKPTTTKPKTTKPTTTKRKKTKKVKTKPSGKFSKEGSERIATANARNAGANITGTTSNAPVGRGDSYGSAAGAVGRRKSLDTLQGTFQGMLTILKLNRAPHKTSRKLTTEGEHSGTGVKGGNTQFEGTQIMERNRGDRTVIRDPTGKPKERKAGRLNYQTTTGGASTLKATTCRLWKTELNETFNNLLDNFQHLYKDYETDKFNEAEGKGKKKPITNTGRSGKGSLGGDTQATPSALGTSRSDQTVMQS